MSQPSSEKVSGDAGRMIENSDEICHPHQSHLRTTPDVQHTPKLDQDWKSQVKAEFFKNLRKPEGSPLTKEELVKLYDAMIENRELMISSLRIGNRDLERALESRKYEPVTFTSLLMVERYEACIQLRKRIIADLEKEKLELVDNKDQYEKSD